MTVGRYDYAYQLHDLPELGDALMEVVHAGGEVLGPKVAQFEESFAHYNGAQYCRGVNSGTDALTLALTAAGVGPGDEVITQANTFHATVAAILHLGAKPVLVDVEADSWTISLEQVEAAIGARTAALLPVHMYGNPSPMGRLAGLAGTNGLALIEDAAQAHGAAVDGQRVGTFGVAGCFSFHPSKNLAAAGDAGAVITDDHTVAEQVDVLRNLGQRGQNHHEVVGFNTKLDSLQAVILSAKLPRLEQWNAERRRLAATYRDALVGTGGVIPSEIPSAEPVHHLFPVAVPERDVVLAALREQGVDAVVRYPTAVHLQPAFEKNDLGRVGAFPVSESIARNTVCLPLFPGMTDDAQAHVVGALHSAMRDVA